MKKVTVISGKGGTGKTIVTANLTALAQDLVLADCDVDAPNMHLLMKPKILEEQSYKGGKVAVKDEEECIDCGLCKKLCNFGAVTDDYEIDEVKCEGCGLCAAKCPTDALQLTVEKTGNIFLSRSRFGPMVHAKLGIGAENSGKLVSEVSQKAEEIAKEQEKDLVLIDGSPGIGCPVVASLNGADMTLIVTEPTKSGLADLKRVLQVTEHFGINALVIINKSDLNEDITVEIEEFCQQQDIMLAGKIPFDSKVVEAMRQGELIVDYNPESRVTAALKGIWKRVNNKLKE
ncbi:ATP-binding protein [Acetohalobium arabaticum]|uniref:Cobyrinic acid ac-diamide synthase n=1 Tax=Acetohalobium arabaticum (strain ATCC 49924 / DSM 5501 / Z-7288) TaxID=574087 RepID=D9QS08_ACEAZ|nr:ATP-binding protein [Acetohalobium arabaticum]ADL13299.1 Cobyrinic acid ac-diamide synthase [Acetohalobium arabaticum DSM 5501]